MLEGRGVEFEVEDRNRGANRLPYGRLTSLSFGSKKLDSTAK